MMKDMGMRFFANVRYISKDDFEILSFHFRSPEVVENTYFHRKKYKNSENLRKHAISEDFDIEMGLNR